MDMGRKELELRCGIEMWCLIETRLTSHNIKHCKRVISAFLIASVIKCDTTLRGNPYTLRGY